MSSIHLVWVPFGLAVGVFSIAFCISLTALVVRYPFLGRFSFLYEKDAQSQKRLNLRVTIAGWGSMLIGFGFSAWSLFRFTQLLNALFADVGALGTSGKLLSVGLPFIYLLIPYQLMRFATAMVFLVAPQDYACMQDARLQAQGTQPLSWGYARQTGRSYQAPSVVGLWQAVDTAMALLILSFTPAAFKWVLDSVALEQRGWLFVGTAGLIFFGIFGLSIRLEQGAWVYGNINQLLLILAKLAVALVLFVLVTTLKEVDLVEVALFSVLALWIGLGAFWGSH